MIGPGGDAKGGGDIELDGFPEFDAYDDDPGSYDEPYGDTAAVGGKRFGGLGGGGAMLVLADFAAEDEKEVSVKCGDVVGACTSPHNVSPRTIPYHAIAPLAAHAMRTRTPF